nr:MAG TPA: hypothetical protein [Caudoviricetes sp.]
MYALVVCILLRIYITSAYTFLSAYTLSCICFLSAASTY